MCAPPGRRVQDGRRRRVCHGPTRWQGGDHHGRGARHRPRHRADVRAGGCGRRGDRRERARVHRARRGDRGGRRQAHAWRLDVAREDEVRAVTAAVVAPTAGSTCWSTTPASPAPNKPTHELTEERVGPRPGRQREGRLLLHQARRAALAPGWRRSIINLSSIYGLVGAADVPPYHASKGAVRLMSKNDALIYAPDKIRVNSVHPGFIWTPMVESFLGNRATRPPGARCAAPARPPGRAGRHRLGRGLPGLRRAKFVTGSELVIDGGYTAR